MMGALRVKKKGPDVMKLLLKEGLEIQGDVVLKLEKVSPKSVTARVLRDSPFWADLTAGKEIRFKRYNENRYLAVTEGVHPWYSLALVDGRICFEMMPLT